MPFRICPEDLAYTRRFYLQTISKASSTHRADSEGNCPDIDITPMPRTRFGRWLFQVGLWRRRRYLKTPADGYDYGWCLACGAPLEYRLWVDAEGVDNAGIVCPNCEVQA